MGHKSFEQLARSAWNAAIKEAKASGNVLYARQWDDLLPYEREAWIAAAKQIVAEMATVH